MKLREFSTQGDIQLVETLYGILQDTENLVI